jgi:hypothetical protein
VCVVGESEFLLLLNEMAVDLGFFLARQKQGPGVVDDDDDDDLDNDLKSTSPPRSTLAREGGESWKKCEKKRRDR